MLRGLLRTARYARSWKAGAEVTVHETEIDRDGEAIAATLVLPARASGALPGWIAIGGVSRMGRFHPQLVRFANAVASSGAAVLVPEIPEWRDLKLAPRVTQPTIRASMEVLHNRPEVRQGKVGLIGFSFGAPQVAIAGADEDLIEDLAGVVLFGGYCCLERTLIYQLTGDHEWEGTDYSLDPDPYGRWCVASNYLTSVPGLEDATDVAKALRTLAAAASEQRVSAWEPYHNVMIRELRDSLPASRQRVFDHFASPTDVERPDKAETLDTAKRLAAACRLVDPLLEPAHELAGVKVPTRLIHGRGDRLIPFTEGMRLQAGLPESTRRGLTVTGLFNHSADSPAISLTHKVRETVRLFGALRGVINTV